MGRAAAGVVLGAALAGVLGLNTAAAAASVQAQAENQETEGPKNPPIREIGAGDDDAASADRRIIVYQ